MTASPAGVRCDLVIPVYNALRSTRACLESVRRFAPPWARVVVINDAQRREHDGVAARAEGHRPSRERGEPRLRQDGEPGPPLFRRAVGLPAELRHASDGGRPRADGGGLRTGPRDRPLLSALQRRRESLGEAASRRGRLLVRAPRGAHEPGALPGRGDDRGVLPPRQARGSPDARASSTRSSAAATARRRTSTTGRARPGWRCVVADDTWIHHRNGGSFTDGGATDGAQHGDPHVALARAAREGVSRRSTGGTTSAPCATRGRSSGRERTTAPPEPHDVLFLVSSALSAEAASALELGNALVLAGFRAGAVALDGAEPENEMELWFRPYRRTTEALRARRPRRGPGSRPHPKRPRSFPPSPSDRGPSIRRRSSGADRSSKGARRTRRPLLEKLSRRLRAALPF